MHFTRFITRNRLDVSVVALGMLAAGAGWAWWGYNEIAAQGPPGGPIRDSADIPAAVQAVLRQAPAPTHDKPTPWGLFVINPVVKGSAVINSQTSPAPEMSGPNARHFEGTGEDAIGRAQSENLPTIDVPAEYRKGMPLLGLRSAVDGPNWIIYLYFGSGDGTEDYKSLEIQAITPRQPVPFEEFPDNAIRDFSANHDVLGNPTLTQFPDTGTADARSERVVAWSQGRGAYVIRTTGLYTDDEVLALARSISVSEEIKR